LVCPECGGALAARAEATRLRMTIRTS